MADLAVWQRTIVDEEGNVIPGAEIEVRREEDDSLATLYADRAGESLLANPLAADMSGFVRFFAQGDAYTITAVGAGSTRTWRFDPTGRLKEFDRISDALAVDDGADTAEARSLLGTFSTVADVQNSHVPAVLDSIRTDGYYTPGDGFGGQYVDEDNGSNDTIISADGRTWYRGRGPGRDFDVTLTVGSSGDYSTVNEALAAATLLGLPRYQRGGFSVEIKLLAGFTMAEQVFVNGLDLGWITITAEDSVVDIDGTAITELLIPNEGNVPVFGGKGGATLPTIGALFAYDPEGDRRDGVTVVDGSRVRFLPSEDGDPGPRSGIRNCRRGITVLYNSEAWCHIPGLTQGGVGSGAGTAVGVDFSGASNRALQVQHGSRASLPRSNFSYCEGDPAVYAIWGSQVNIYQSNISHATNTAVQCRDGSTINARETNVSDSGVGYHALHNARINARSRLPSSGNPWVGDGAQRCSSYGVHASYNSTIECPNLSVDDCGNRGVHASGGSVVNFSGGSAKNCGGPAVFATSASTINASNVDASGSDIGFQAGNGSRVNASGSVADGCKQGFYAYGASTIAAEASSAKNCTDIGYFAEKASTINAHEANADGCYRGFESREDSTINARLGRAVGCSNRAISCIDGGRAVAQNFDGRNAGAIGVTCRGGRVFCLSADFSGAGNHGLEVRYGGIIAGYNASGTLSQDANIITSDGIIIQ